MPACVMNDAVYAFGDEPGVWDPPLEPGEKCRDCGVTPGHAHQFCCAVACCRPCSDEKGVLVQRFLCDCWCDQGDALGLEAPEVPHEDPAERDWRVLWAGPNAVGGGPRPIRESDLRDFVV